MLIIIVGNFSENSFVKGSNMVPATSKIIAPSSDKYAEIIGVILLGCSP